MSGIAVTYSGNFLALLSVRFSNTVPGCSGPAINSPGNTPHSSEFYVPAKCTRAGPLRNQRIMMLKWVGGDKEGSMDGWVGGCMDE